MENMKTFSALREAHPNFIYESYDIIPENDHVKLVFHFSVEGLSCFSPSWVFPTGGSDVDLSSPTFHLLVFNLGMAELVSYWKIACPKSVIVKAGHLSEKQIKWWKKLYFNGLGEFFYLNSIDPDPDTFMSISSTVEESAILRSDRPLSGNLIPVGGGKDSSVSLELLREYKEENFPYIINPRGATTESAKAAGLSDKTVCVTRTLDPEMLRLNKEGYLNGHTPFSAVVAFSGVLAAYIKGLRYVVLSNESSANESTVASSYVNHQYSKSFEFERDFHTYEEEYIKSGVYYFSLLRPLSEYQIAKYFSRLKKYHPIFKSCNRGSHQNIWCGNCPKCLFVWLILSPFLSHSELIDIFGRDMANDTSLIPTLDKLTGLEPEKPFECVGSRAEVNFALTECIKKSSALPALYDYYSKTPLYKEFSALQNPYDIYRDDNNLLPPEFMKIIERECYD